MQEKIGGGVEIVFGDQSKQRQAAFPGASSALEVMLQNQTSPQRKRREILPRQYNWGRTDLDVLPDFRSSRRGMPELRGVLWLGWMFTNHVEHATSIDQA